MTDAYTTQLELLEPLVDTTTPPLFVPSIESCEGPINASFAEGEPITGQVSSAGARLGDEQLHDERHRPPGRPLNGRSPHGRERHPPAGAGENCMQDRPALSCSHRRRYCTIARKCSPSALRSSRRSSAPSTWSLNTWPAPRRRPASADQIVGRRVRRRAVPTGSFRRLRSAPCFPHCVAGQLSNEVPKVTNMHNGHEGGPPGKGHRFDQNDQHEPITSSSLIYASAHNDAS